jgi:hypothetical protein
VGRRLASAEAAARKARRTKPSSPKRLTYSLRLARLQKRRSFSAYIRLFEPAEDYGGELTVTRARTPHNQTEIAECGAPLARILKDLFLEARRTTAQVQTTRITLSGSDSELAFLRRAVLKAAVVDDAR